MSNVDDVHSQNRKGSTFAFGLRSSCAYGWSRTSGLFMSSRRYTFNGSRAVAKARLFTTTFTHRLDAYSVPYAVERRTRSYSYHQSVELTGKLGLFVTRRPSLTSIRPPYGFCA